MDQEGLERIMARADDLLFAGRDKEALGSIEAELPEVISSGLDRSGLMVRRAMLLLSLGRSDDGYEAVAELVEAGVPVPLQWKGFKELEGRPGMEAIVEKNSANLAKAQAASRMRYEVHLPRGFDRGRRYPVLFTLHGDGLDGSISEFKGQWPPGSVDGLDIILVYVQSSQFILPQRYVWMRDLDRAAEDVAECYRQVIKDYPVDLDKVIVSGFSGGSVASLHIAIASGLPFRKFIAVCPGRRPSSVTSDKIAEAAAKGVRGVVLEGELEPPSEEEKEMLNDMERLGLPCMFVINPGIGHFVPADLVSVLPRCVTFVMDG